MCLQGSPNVPQPLRFNIWIVSMDLIKLLNGIYPTDDHSDVRCDSFLFSAMRNELVYLTSQSCAILQGEST